MWFTALATGGADAGGVGAGGAAMSRSKRLLPLSLPAPAALARVQGKCKDSGIEHPMAHGAIYLIKQAAAT